MSPLWKLKYDLYLTEERILYCKISKSNRCSKCSKVDYTGHFLLCTNSMIKKICSKLIEYCLSVDKNLSAEKIIHMDTAHSQQPALSILVQVSSHGHGLQAFN